VARAVHLRELTVEGYDFVEASDALLDAVACGAPRLRVLALRCKRSQSVVSARNLITDAGVERLLHAMPGLRSLALQLQPRLTDRVLELVATLAPRMHTLDLSATCVKDVGLAHLRTLRHLRHLRLRFCSMVTDGGVWAVVSSQPRLLSLDIAHTSATDHAVWLYRLVVVAVAHFRSDCACGTELPRVAGAVGRQCGRVGRLGGGGIAGGRLPCALESAHRYVPRTPLSVGVSCRAQLDGQPTLRPLCSS
jgi:hypothetical protein